MGFFLGEEAGFRARAFFGVGLAAALRVALARLDAAAFAFFIGDPNSLIGENRERLR